MLMPSYEVLSEAMGKTRAEFAHGPVREKLLTVASAVADGQTAPAHSSTGGQTAHKFDSRLLSFQKDTEMCADHPLMYLYGETERKSIYTRYANGLLLRITEAMCYHGVLWFYQRNLHWTMLIMMIPFLAFIFGGSYLWNIQLNGGCPLSERWFVMMIKSFLVFLGTLVPVWLCAKKEKGAFLSCHEKKVYFLWVFLLAPNMLWTMTAAPWDCLADRINHSICALLLCALFVRTSGRILHKRKLVTLVDGPSSTPRRDGIQGDCSIDCKYMIVHMNDWTWVLSYSIWDTYFVSRFVTDDIIMRAIFSHISCSLTIPCVFMYLNRWTLKYPYYDDEGKCFAAYWMFRGPVLTLYVIRGLLLDLMVPSKVWHDYMLLDEVIDPVLETPLFLAVMYLHFAFALVVLGAALRSILTSAQPHAQQSDPHPSDDVLTPASDPPPIPTLLKVIG